MNDLKHLKTRFLEYLEIEKGRSVKTVENYDRYLTRYLAFSKVTSPSKITEQSVREFLKFLRKRDIESLNPERIELAKVGQRDLDLITADELNRLILAPSVALAKGGTDPLVALRDRAILELFFSTGLRVSEL